MMDEAETGGKDGVAADTEKLYTSLPHAATIAYADEFNRVVSFAAATNMASTHTNELMERSGEPSAAAVRFHTLAEAVTTSGENSPAPRRRLRMQKRPCEPPEWKPSSANQLNNTNTHESIRIVDLTK